MSIADELNAKNATPETILQIMQTSVFEASGDLTPDEMLDRLSSAAGDPNTVDTALGKLREAPDLIGEVALLWIAAASQAEETRGIIQDAVADADREMPLMEIGALTLIALYAIYRLTPNKPLRSKRKILRRLPSGRFEQVDEQTEFDGFSEPAKGLLGIFSGAADQE